MLSVTPWAALRPSLRTPVLLAAPPSGARPPRLRPFSSSAARYASPAVSADKDHYAVLGVPKEATRKQIKEKFYELSRKFHPDAPSTSSDTPEQRTARFQQLSQSYSVLSDPDQRRSYDLTRTGSSVGQHRRRPHHPGYTSASGGQGYAAGSGPADGAWTDNDERRTRANYAWQHPSRSGQKSAGEAAAGQAQARADPFASRRARATHGATDHFATYAGRARTRSEQASAGGAAAAMGSGAAGSHYRAGTSVFGAAKAEEESRLINDSSTLRSGQVVFVFLVVFALAYGFSGGKERHENKGRR
ncbi:J domain-containing protein [Rhodotorula paludigena]|uniref:J domain-containing protein n=1 Tax=Rhodotorula paludigena TaxID=86838 RepID=UPI0031730E60